MSGAARYAATQAEGLDEILGRHAGLVKRIAYHLISRLPSSVQVDDLIQAGMIGLLEAARHYDASQGASFETYAGIRIRGAMLDEIRKNDWAPRSVHRRAREVAQAIHEVENRHGRDARDSEVAEALGISLDEYHRILQDASSCRLFSLDDVGDDESGLVEDLPSDVPDPQQGMQAEDFRRSLVQAIDSLPERERLVLALYYDDELNLKEVGAVLGVSESRVSQIHGQAVLRLKSRLHEWSGD
ncbi:MAG: RNA polymerase sigma factor FliA [Acidiferrobacterales bacterium]